MNIGVARYCGVLHRHCRLRQPGCGLRIKMKNKVQDGCGHSTGANDPGRVNEEDENGQSEPQYVKTKSGPAIVIQNLLKCGPPIVQICSHHRVMVFFVAPNRRRSPITRRLTLISPATCCPIAGLFTRRIVLHLTTSLVEGCSSRNCITRHSDVRITPSKPETVNERGAVGRRVTRGWSKPQMELLRLLHGPVLEHQVCASSRRLRATHSAKSRGRA